MEAKASQRFWHFVVVGTVKLAYHSPHYHSYELQFSTCSIHLSLSKVKDNGGFWTMKKKRKTTGGYMFLLWPVILLTLLPFHRHQWGIFLPTSILQEDIFVNLFSSLPLPAVELLIILLFLRFYFLSPPYLMSLCCLYNGIGMHCHVFSL